MLTVKIRSDVVSQKARDALARDALKWGGRRDEESVSRLYRIIDMIDWHEVPFREKGKDAYVDVDEELFKFLEF